MASIKKFGFILGMVNSILSCDFDVNDDMPAEVVTLGNGTKIKGARPSIELLLPMGNEIKWEGFLCNQPTWIRELLPIIEYKDKFPNQFEIVEEYDLPETPELIIVDDGSVKFNSMSFGWVIANRDGIVLVQGAGPSHGKGSSLRAEGSGMLDATVFMALVCKFTQRVSLFTSNFSDNQELIRRLRNHQEYTILFPKKTIRAEFDLIKQIYSTSSES